MDERTEILLAMYRAMKCARFIEDIEENYVKQGKAFFYMPGKGHEGSAALASSLIPQDYLACHYRDKALMVARGARPVDFFRNMFCTADSDSAGRQMSAFLHNRKLHMLSLSGPVTNAALQACGIAANLVETASMQEERPIVYCGLGDGMTQEGEFYEAILFAANERLPVLFVVEDNGYAISTRTAGKTFFSSPAGDEKSFCGVPIERVNGLNPAEARQQFSEIVARIRERGYNRAQNGKNKSETETPPVPALVVLQTERLSNHTNADNQTVYRSAEELQKAAEERDPVSIFEQTLLRAGISPETLEAIKTEEQERVREDLKTAGLSPAPEPCFDAKAPADFESISAGRYPLHETARERYADKHSFTMNEAINAVLFNRLAVDERVTLFGEDIEDPKGDVFGVTRGLSSAFPERVKNSPLAEATIAGVSAGRALTGGKPVAFFQFADFTPVAMNQLFSEIGNMYWRTAGSWQTPVIFMVSCGAYRPGLGPFHASTLESMILQIPGIDVFMPSTAAGAAGLLNTAFESGRPSVFFYPKNALNDRSLSCETGELERAVNPGKLRKISSGGDITLIGWGNTAQLVKDAADILLQNGKTADVLELLSLSPWDEHAVIDSVKKTGHLIVVQEDNRTCGFASEVISSVNEYFSIQDESFFIHNQKKSTVPKTCRISRPDTYVPFHFGNQLAILPSVETVVERAAQMLGGTVTWLPDEDAQSEQGDGAGNELPAAVYAAGSSPSDEIITVVEWLIAPGDSLTQGQIIAQMEADKTSFEFASPVTGTVHKLCAENGDTLEVGKELFLYVPAQTPKAEREQSAETSVRQATALSRMHTGKARIEWKKKPAEIKLCAAELQNGPDNAREDAKRASEKTAVGITAPSVITGSRTVTTEELEREHGWKDLEKKNGIKTRYWAADGEDALTLGLAAAKKTLESCNLSVCDLDLLICATGSPVTISPSLACRIVHALSLSEAGERKPSAGAYDFSAACSGYLYGLQIAYDFIQSKPDSRVLLVTSEVLSRQINSEDPGTAPIFSDAATATLICAENRLAQAVPFAASLLRPEISSAAEDGKALEIPRDISKPIHMDGPAVFLAAVREMGSVLEKTCRQFSITPQDLDLVIPHQANQRILNAVRQKMHLKPEQVFSNIAQYGNTSSSSIPIALHDVLCTEKRVGTFGLCAFGAGFTFASCILESSQRNK